ncbi:Leucine-rich repeat protein 1 [Nymphon striatum]|nr:Leucine-rich repeat protein 1 [Nymphon striatum]
MYKKFTLTDLSYFLSSVMRLRCDAEICSRLSAINNIRHKRKREHSSLALGCSSGTDQNTLCILVCTAQNKIGTKYKLKHNISKLHSRFSSEGKATISVVKPPVDIIISKANPEPLCAFLDAIKSSSGGRKLNSASLSRLEAANLSQVERPKTKLSISNRQKYPVTFEKSLIELTITKCLLRSVDPRILRLNLLQVLDLSHNNIKKIPNNLCELKLSELYLHHNEISELPNELFNRNLCLTLCVLDISFNHVIDSVAIISDKFEVHNDIEINAQQDKNIYHTYLKVFTSRSGSSSRISMLHPLVMFVSFTLPGSVINLNMEYLDVANNPYNYEELIYHNHLKFPSLKEIAGCVVKLKKVPYGSGDIPNTLISMLELARHCLCGKPCFESFIFTTQSVSLIHQSRNMTLSPRRNQDYPLGLFFCSHSCHLRAKHKQFIQ